jgi:hypothetical protein
MNKGLRGSLSCLIRVVAVLLLPIVCGWFALTANILINNIRAAHFGSPLFNYPLPPDTTVIRRYTEVIRTGSGNHCDFGAIQVMETSLSEEEVRAYYSDVSFPRPIGSIYPDPAPHLIDFDDATASQETLTFSYILFDANQPPGIDLRCH